MILILEAHTSSLAPRLIFSFCMQEERGNEPSYETLGPIVCVYALHRTVPPFSGVYRIDAQYVLKVADFGLSEAKCNKDYVRQQMTSEVKLPIKWMAPESINDGIFSEKTDVVRM